MPWAEVSTMSLRYEFVLLSLKSGANMAELCRRFGVSRKTGYKWRERFDRGGLSALEDRSRRPRHSPKRTPAPLRAAVIQLRRHRRWGGRKIHHRLQAQGHRHVPAPSTISGILKRHGLIDPNEALKHQPVHRFERARPNELWQMDFKATSPSVLDAVICSLCWMIIHATPSPCEPVTTNGGVTYVSGPYIHDPGVLSPGQVGSW